MEKSIWVFFSAFPKLLFCQNSKSSIKLKSKTRVWRNFVKDLSRNTLTKMDSMKQKFGNESPEDKQKRKKQLVLPNIGTLAVCIAMVAVGVSYNGEEDCKGKATTFLILGGGIVCATTVLKLIAFWTLWLCECDDKIMDILSPIANFAHFCVMIWGSVVVFGQYSQWTYEEKNSEFYCAYTPFMFAFVILVLKWSFFLFILCCMVCCCAFCYKPVENNDAAWNWFFDLWHFLHFC